MSLISSTESQLYTNHISWDIRQSNSLNYRCQTGLIQSNNHVHAWQLANLVIAASCKMKNIKITPADNLSTVNNNLTELPMGEIKFSTKDVVVPLHL